MLNNILPILGKFCFCILFRFYFIYKTGSSKKVTTNFPFYSDNSQINIYFIITRKPFQMLIYHCGTLRTASQYIFRLYQILKIGRDTV